MTNKNKEVDMSNFEEIQKEYMSNQDIKPKQKKSKKAVEVIEDKPKEIIESNNINAEELIIEYISIGHSLRSAIEMVKAKGKPYSSKTFFKQIKENEEIGKQYARACDERTHLIFEEIIDITDEKMFDQVEVQQARLKVDARKWMLSKMNPKKYGDKIEVDSTINAEIKTHNINYSELSTDTLMDIFKHSKKND